MANWPTSGAGDATAIAGIPVSTTPPSELQFPVYYGGELVWVSLSDLASLQSCGNGVFSSNQIAAGETKYFGDTGLAALSATDVALTIAPPNRTKLRVFVGIDTDPGAGKAIRFTVREATNQAAAFADTTGFAACSTSELTNTTTQITVTAGRVYSIKAVSDAGANSVYIRAAFLFTP